MSGLAQWLFRNGIEVSGYDKAVSVVTKRLVQQGVQVDYEFALIPSSVDTLVYTPAVKDHPAILNPLSDVKYIKRSELLAHVVSNRKVLAVAGTHGKTSTTALLTFLLHQLGYEPLAFVGGWMTDFDSNYTSGEGPYAVVEADEFDRSFLQLSPYAGAITSLDADHLDIYGDRPTMIQNYQQFYEQINSLGFCLINAAFYSEITPQHCPLISIGGTNAVGYYQIHSRTVADGFQQVIVNKSSEHWISFRLPLPGEHNAINALFALAMLDQLGMDVNQAAQVLTSYRGVDRRFQVLHKNAQRVIVLDYAHHPTEISSAISAARELYPTHKLVVFFQPHLYSRTRDFMSGFAEELSKADEVFLTEIYPARELPIPGISSSELIGRVTSPAKFFFDKTELPIILRQLQSKVSTPTCTLILGAGDIDCFLPTEWD